ncbi:MAG TPA: hypothetical protein VGF63_00280 [Solirubrobacteraceae bacterium]
MLGPVGAAVAACPTRPLPPCNAKGDQLALTGSVRTHTSSTRCGAAKTPSCTGKKGARGPKGATGKAGVAGRAGAQGVAGSTGAVGSAGTAGATGPTGQQGLAGVSGEVGAAGTQGARGIQGPAGTTGATGATGAAGAGGLSEYAFVYNLGAQVVPIEADIAFDTNGPMSAGVTHAPGAAGIQMVNAGIYKFTFTVSGVEPSQMAMLLNGVKIAGSVYGSGAGTQLNAGQAIATVAAGDVLTLRNHSSAAAVTLQTLAGGTQANTNASMIIERVG